MSHLKEDQNSEHAFLVYVNSDEADDTYAENELEGLCEAAGAKPIGSMRQRVSRPHVVAYIGKGKLEELALYVKELKPDLVIFDCELSGIQNRNISEATSIRTIDRTQLILDIFALRAHTKEGQLQVELAQLMYMMPRLMSVYTKFERQKGGIGLRGPGETKLESDRRMVKNKVSHLKSSLEAVEKHRGQHRESRRKHPFPFASIVGYTSAGKSTLMNRLSGTELLADDMPFATLDPTTRKLDLDQGYSLFLTDTVGFIRNLPTHLVSAFHSTLEEVTCSDFLIHVIDISDSHWDIQRDAVLATLQILKAENKPSLVVFNKCDLIKNQNTLNELAQEWPSAVLLSAKTGHGIGSLMQKLIEKVKEYLRPIVVLIPYHESGLVEQCYKYGRVLLFEYQEEGIYLKADVVDELHSRLKKYELL